MRINYFHSSNFFTHLASSALLMCNSEKAIEHGSCAVPTKIGMSICRQRAAPDPAVQYQILIGPPIEAVSQFCHLRNYDSISEVQLFQWYTGTKLIHSVESKRSASIGQSVHIRGLMRQNIGLAQPPATSTP